MPTQVVIETNEEENDQPIIKEEVPEVPAQVVVNDDHIEVPKVENPAYEELPRPYYEIN